MCLSVSLNMKNILVCVKEKATCCGFFICILFGGSYFYLFIHSADSWILLWSSASSSSSSSSFCGGGESGHKTSWSWSSLSPPAWIPLGVVDPALELLLLGEGSFSSFHLSIERRRAFIKKFPTVVGSRPSWRAIVTCISFEGRFVSWRGRKEEKWVLGIFRNFM